MYVIGSGYLAQNRVSLFGTTYGHAICLAAIFTRVPNNATPATKSISFYCAKYHTSGHQ